VVAGEASLDSGPVMIQNEFVVDAPCAREFAIAMAELGRHRRRSGVLDWWLFQDTADPTRFVETWVEATWAEHLRYHERVSVAQKQVEQRAQALLRKGTTLVTRHFIAPNARPSASTHACAATDLRYPETRGT